MATYSRTYIRATTRKRGLLWIPSAETLVFICMGMINLVYMLNYLPAGISSILIYPFTLGFLVFVNASVALIFWLDHRRYIRPIVYAFILPLICVVLAGVGRAI